MKKVIEFIKELKKKPYGKAVFFFGFYLIFFIVIFIILNLGGNNRNKDNNSSDNKYFNNYNYSFEYKVIVDGTTYIYTGNKNNNIFNYIYNNMEYINKNNVSYIKGDESKEIENPIKFSDFFKENIIEEIINSSYVESRTIYDNGVTTLNLFISSNTLNRIIDKEETDYEEIPNNIKLSVDDNKINEINYNLDSYCKIKNICNKLNIIINYKDYSERS